MSEWRDNSEWWPVPWKLRHELEPERDEIEMLRDELRASTFRFRNLLIGIAIGALGMLGIVGVFV